MRRERRLNQILHDYHSLIYAAMLADQSRVALESVDRMEATIT